MWQHPDWRFQKHSELSKLARYAQLFNTVEGNTTFYHLPRPAVAASWQSAASGGFYFSFKFPKQVTHDGHWQNCDEFERFFQLLSGFECLGPVQIQLPARFTGHRLEELADFIEALPQGYRYSVEVRHEDFFNKGDHERAFNRLLLDSGVGRTLFDTRPLFRMPATAPEVIDGQQKKPKVPLHVVATAGFVVVRYIGYPDWVDNEPWFTPWIEKIKGWLDLGKDVYLFAHTPDNAQAPELALDMRQAIVNLERGRAQLLDAQPQSSLF